VSRVVEATSRTGDVVRDSGKGGGAPADFITARKPALASAGVAPTARRQRRYNTTVVVRKAARAAARRQAA
jgi:hypothetical protein